MFQSVTLVTVKKKTVVYRALSEASGIIKSKSAKYVLPEPKLPSRRRVPVVRIVPCFCFNTQSTVSNLELFTILMGIKEACVN